MNPILFWIAVGGFVFALFSILAFGYCLLSMGPYMSPDTPKVGGRCSFPFRTNEYFTDPRGKTYRDWCLIWLAAMLIGMMIFVALISTVPNFQL